MNFIRKKSIDAVVGVCLANSIDCLSAIHHRGCGAAIWRRPLQEDLQAWLNALDPDQLPRARVILRHDQVKEALRQACEIAQTPEAEQRETLVADATTLATSFARLMDAPYLRLRFDVIKTNACRRFHIDAVTARLICTYRGTGTQYSIETNRGGSTRIFTTLTGAPIVLRGSLWPEHPKSGLLHRSPLIEGTGETLLVLVLDRAVDPDDLPDLQTATRH